MTPQPPVWLVDEQPEPEPARVHALEVGAEVYLFTRALDLERYAMRIDEDNIVATLKPVCDGIVDAGVVPDDTPEYMTKVMPVVVAPARSARTGRLWLIITPGPGRDRPTGGLPDVDD